MSEKPWYICISDNVFGPLDTETVHLMMHQSRLQFHNYVWREGLQKWTPMFQISEFAMLAPPYPKSPLPVIERATPAPVVVPVPATLKAKLTPLAPAEQPIPVRSSSRVAVAGKVKVDGAGEYDIIDLSISGVFVACTLPLVIGAEIKFQIHVHGLKKALDMTGIVVRQGISAQKVSGYAFEFIRPNPAHLRLLAEFIEPKKMGQAG